MGNGRYIRVRWNIAPETISLVILGIIWVYSRKGSHLPSLKNRMFQECLTVTFAAMLSNILSTFMLSGYILVPVWVTWAITTIYFILTPLMGMVYYLYAVSVLYEERPQLYRMILLGGIPGAVYTLLVLSNFFTKCLFDITANQGYEQGSLIFITYLIFYGYCAGCIVIAVRNRRYIDRHIYHILATFPVLAVIVIFFQQMYPNIILSGTAATCALLIIYLHLQNRQISLDYLTNVPNRQELLNMLDLLLRRYPDKDFTLLVVSIRDFRQINNICGQHRGDAFLKQVCAFLCSAGPKENVYRYSGDEFALLFINDRGERVRQCVLDIEARMKQPWQNQDYQFKLPVVMGVIRRSEYVKTLEEAVSYIEYAVSQAKTGRYGQICYCDQEMLEKLERRKKIIRILKEQLANHSVEMYYQPIYSVRTRQFLYAESLMRMNHTSIGPVYPNEFIPIAEETGLIIELTYVILDEVCKYINRLIEKGLPMEAIHVNFSAIQFSQPDLSRKVLEIIQRNGTPMSAVKIEFTESTLAENPQVVTDFALEMRKHGIEMGLDDFGTGYSNIATVIRIPFGTIKLDKSLVWASIDNPTSALTIRHLVHAFRDLGMTVIAEGVETESQRQLVEDIGVEQIQGYYYSKPLSMEEMEAFLKINRDGSAGGGE